MSIKTKIVSIIAILSLWSAVSHGQDNLWRNYPYEIIGGFGPSFMLGELGGGPGIGRNSIVDLDFLSTRFGGSIGLRKTFQDRLSWQFTYTMGVISGDDAKTTEYFRSSRNLSFKAPIQEFSGRLEYKIRKEKRGHIYDLRGVRGERSIKVASFCYIGLGIYHFNPKAYINDKWVELQPIGTEGQNFMETRHPYSRFQVCVPMGIIAKYSINKKWAVSAELGLRFLFTDYLDDVSTTYADPDMIASYDNTVSDIEAKLAADPAYADHCFSNGVYHFYNEQRGDPYDRDFYMFMMISAHYRLKENKAGWPTFQDLKKRR